MMLFQQLAPSKHAMTQVSMLLRQLSYHLTVLKGDFPKAHSTHLQAT